MGESVESVGEAALVMIELSPLSLPWARSGVSGMKAPAPRML